jgi:acetyl-CoA carboxylase biotin carboxylase subunit
MSDPMSGQMIDSLSDPLSDEQARPLRKVLVANRGEIAVRVLRALRELQITSVAIYSDADRDSLAVRLADEAYWIGPAPSSQSYLCGERIVALAREIGADGIHPGYGFLSENAGFAAACETAGVVFIGPPSAAMAAMGSKIESRRRMRAAGVPVVPGGTDPLRDESAARTAAEGIGYPVMLKASAGGGGKGMRLVSDGGQLAAAFRSATSEALSSFGDGAVYLEKYIERPRHVEIQILADRFGNVVSLGERECSLQRRHQKVVEESPSTAVDAELRQRMGAAAVQAAAAVGYTNAGTIEFLLAADGSFYFLEMNTRLQVEHPVTELVTGCDLVVEQLRIAQGYPLREGLAQVTPRGHAIEVRLYAEDPFRGFAPSPGRIERLRWPEGPGVRNDCGVLEGSEVTIHYDPMLGKLIVWGADRAEALRRLRRALTELRIEGIRTTVPLYLQLLEDEDFQRGNLDIDMLDRKLRDGELGAQMRVTSSSPDGGAFVADLPFLAAAIQHQATQRLAPPAAVSQGARRLWQRAARSEGLRP